MFVRMTLSVVPVLLLVVLVPVGNLSAATVKPLEVFSEKILVLEIEYFATEHSLNSRLLRRSVDCLNREMNIMSKSNVGESLKLLTNVARRIQLLPRVLQLSATT